jgi:lipopolysaccharide/colanic/teichoic acid biosynthesis glycosyltransferase
MQDVSKRFIDILGSLAILICLAPLIAVVGALVGLRLGRPILFQQDRPGLHGRIFRMVKFRTMTSARNGRGQLLADADRMTPFGRWLRSTSLDELPELWNVLKGDMSLVGPRPLLVEYLPLYSAFQVRRHEVRPGVTGWAQINGRNGISWEERFALDVWYVDNRSLALDLRILVLTLAKVWSREGVQAEGHATMDYFRGNEQGGVEAHTDGHEKAT